MFRCQNLWPLGFYFAVPNPHLVHAIHQLRDQIEVETSASESRNLMLRRQNHTRIFKRIIEIVAGHEGGRLRSPVAIFKTPARSWLMRVDYVVFRKSPEPLSFRLLLFTSRLLLLRLKQRGIFAVTFF